ncbi:MAG: NAD(P)/FAD-dependent oxidoreductase [Methylococcaceae bacterium]|nr:MAG: NAD(P)/FAD-dependent oxidoreductase [Methylococcaceae bacterium]
MNITIVGSGVAGVTCADALIKANHSVTLITRETAGYYSRPMLSHGFSHDDVEQQIVTRSFDELSQSGIHVHSHCDVRRIDAAQQRLTCINDHGEFMLNYDTLILALGSMAFVPPPLTEFRRLFNVLNELNDLIILRRLRQRARKQDSSARWAIIGGGLIGCELAADLAKAGDAVTVFHVAGQLMERQLQADDADTLQHTLEQAGIALELNCNVLAIEEEGDYRAVVTQNARHGGYCGVIIACGFKPRALLAEQAGLAVQRGITVDGWLRTSDPHIHAIGDVAQCSDGRIYAFIAPIRSQAQWLAQYLSGATESAWTPPVFHPKAKIHGFTASHPYQF